MGRLEDIKNSLIKDMEQMEIIDCHEHLPPERIRTESQADVFTLFSHYNNLDLLNAGMTKEQVELALYSTDISLECKWKLFKPYFELSRNTSYSRAVLLTLKNFYGFEDINDNTYKSISEAVRKENKPGLYKKVLRDFCKIRYSLTMGKYVEGSGFDLDSSLLVPLSRWVMGAPVTRDEAMYPPFDPSGSIRSLDDYLDSSRKYIHYIKENKGVVGLKMKAFPFKEANRDEAVKLFEKLKEDCMDELPENNPLKDYIVDRTIACAGEEDMVVAVHTGYWGDFRKLDPLHMIPLLQRHGNVRFDIFHLGYPWVRESLMLGKGFPNVWLNLCWTHIISQKFAKDAMDEAIDLIPANKMLAFGADYGKPVENVIGHLIMAREDMAEVLAKRIHDRRINENQALKLAKKWFWDNPVDLYNLEV